MARARRNRRSGPPGRRRLPPLAWRLVRALAAALLVGAALVAFARLLDQPIERLTVSGTLQHVTARQVSQVVRSELHGAGLVSVNLRAISRALAALPWVDSVTVQRAWPRGLSVQIVEQSAIARWNGSGLLNARGEQFLPSLAGLSPALAAALPDLAGPQGSEQEVTARYLAMQEQLTPRSLRVTRLTLDARGAWQFALADGVLVRLGRSHVDERFARFVLAAAPLVQKHASAIAYVDMRYGNGFAVGWRAGRVVSTGDHSNFNG